MYIINLRKKRGKEERYFVFILKFSLRLNLSVLIICIQGWLVVSFVTSGTSLFHYTDFQINNFTVFPGHRSIIIRLQLRRFVPNLKIGNYLETSKHKAVWTSLCTPVVSSFSSRSESWCSRDLLALFQNLLFVIFLLLIASPNIWKYLPGMHSIIQIFR